MTTQQLIDSDSGSDWEDDQPLCDVETQCLFCENPITSINPNGFSHCTEAHALDLPAFFRKHKLDFYEYIQLINYVQREKVTPTDLLDKDKTTWCQEIYRQPVVQDLWIFFDFDGYVESESKTDVISISKVDFQKFHDQKELIQQLLEEKEQMKKTFLALSGINEVGIRENGEPGTNTVIKKNDSYYFSGYGHYSIHLDMLTDTTRTTSYRDAIVKNRSLFENKTVLDVGCGTGILSMFCCEAGAKTVYAVDSSSIIYNAMEIANENKLDNKITFIKKQVEEIEDVDIPKVDVIVSEWMGYFLLFEGMLESVIYARDKFLTPNGQMLPNRCSMYLVGCCNEGTYNHHVNFWSNVYGYKMSSMRRDVIKEAVIQVVPENELLTDPVTLIELDLLTCTVESLNFKCDFQLNVLKSGRLFMLCGYFDSFFDLDVCVVLGTGPLLKSTHWKQCLFLLDEPVDVVAGEIIPGTLDCKLSKTNRNLEVEIEVFGRAQKYLVC